jgi:hypothetical protein
MARAVTLPLALLSVHPLHTSLAEIVYNPAAKEIRISIRVFVDDLTTATNAYTLAHPMPGTAKSVLTPTFAYAVASFVVTDNRGRRLSFDTCGEKRVGDLMWICLRAPAPAGPVGFRVAHKILFDLYPDQINIVQAAYNGKRISLLFTRGDGLKRLD